jgi:hypothetical protein
MFYEVSVRVQVPSTVRSTADWIVTSTQACIETTEDLVHCIGFTRR